MINDCINVYTFRLRTGTTTRLVVIHIWLIEKTFMFSNQITFWILMYIAIHLGFLIMVRAEDINTVGNILGAMNETHDKYTYNSNTHTGRLRTIKPYQNKVTKNI